MNTGLHLDNRTVVQAFRTALVHQGLVVLLVMGLVAAVLAVLQAWLKPGSAAGPTDRLARPGRLAAPVGRQVLVLCFGNLWLFDGILQAQPRMALGLPSQVIKPATAGSPAWMQHLVTWASTAWSYHPVQAAAAAVWIQVGLGIWLLTARGAASRLAGLASVGWALVIWVFGESLGGIAAPGLSFLTGAPGAAALYLVAGVLIALPDRAWSGARLGRLVLAGLGLLLAGLPLLQAWPGRGSWTGISHGRLGPLAAAADSMALTPQPLTLAKWVAAFGAFDAAHGFAVNAFVVTALGLAGAAFFSGRSSLIRPAVISFAMLCLADWVLVQDLGILGGLGTDPGSMIPFIVLAWAGYLTLTSPVTAPAAATKPAAAADGAQAPQSTVARTRGLAPAALARRALAANAWSLAAAVGAGLFVLGAVPLAVAQASRDADPILAESVAGQPRQVDYPAPPFTLTDQHGNVVTLASLRGKVVLLSFPGPACGRRCPPVQQEFRRTAALLGPSAHQVEFVWIALNPGGRAAAGAPDCLYLTGTPDQLRQVRRGYEAAGPAAAGGSRVSLVYLIDRAGRVRQVYRTGRGPGTGATTSSFAVLFTAAARHVLGAPRSS